MSMQHWESTHESMRDALAAISEEKFLAAPGLPRGVDSFRPTFDLDVLETAEVFEVHASVPGIAVDRIDISVFGDSLRIAGERIVTDTGRMTEDSDYRWLVRERPVGHFDRSVRFPSPIHADQTTAEVADRVLIVTLPKTVASAPRTIVVRDAVNSRLDVSAAT